MKPTRKGFIWPMIAAIAIAGGSYFGTVQFMHPNSALAQSPSQTARPAPTPQSEAVAPANELSRAFRVVHESLENAVVNINVSKKQVAQGGRVRLQIPDEMRNMLPPGFDPDQLQGQLGDPVVEGTGSGVIVSADGYILTNNHVVDSADDITVALNDGRELKAQLVGTDPKTDLAVVRVKADHLTFAKFGDSDGLQVGDWVLAFGSPFGFSQTMTQGIISAKGRHVPIIAQHNPALQGMTYENFLQTDAAINPGNSGGPLVNLKGEVVGINAAIASNTGAYNGIGFSIPSNDAQYVMHSLIEHGKVVRGYMGIEIEDVSHPSPEDKGLIDGVRKEGFSGDRGIFVKSTIENGPAAKSGLQPGDVITAVSGKPASTVEELRTQIARSAPDTKLPLTVFRDGKTREITIALGTQPDTVRPVAQMNPGRVRNQPTDSGELGARVDDTDSAAAQRYNVGNVKGALVTGITPRSLAAEAGLKPGDVITRLDKTEITSAKQLNDALAGAKLSDGVRLQVHSSDGMDRMVYVEKK